MAENLCAEEGTLLFGGSEHRERLHHSSAPEQPRELFLCLLLWLHTPKHTHRLTTDNTASQAYWTVPVWLKVTVRC